MIQVIACPHPLRADRLQFELEPGASVEDAIVEAAERGNVPLSGMANAVVVIGDRIVPKDRWRHVRPKSGTVAIKAMAADPVSLSLVASVAGWASGYVIPVSFALAYPVATSLITAGIAWTSPIRTSMTP